MSTPKPKLTFKRVEIPLNKIVNEAIPQHVALFNKFKNRQMRLSEKPGQTNRLQHEASQSVKQVKQLLHELDMLRCQVDDNDLDKFDKLSLSARESLQQTIKGYTEFLSSKARPQQYLEDDARSDQPTDEQRQLQMLEDDMKVKMEEFERKQRLLDLTQNLENEITEVNVVFNQLSELVHDQGEIVENVETQVETAAVELREGNKHLERAEVLVKSAYPMTGAIVGTCLGGPLGLVVGLKVGSVMALSGGLLGYFSGSVLKKA